MTNKKTTPKRKPAKPAAEKETVINTTVEQNKEIPVEETVTVGESIVFDCPPIDKAGTLIVKESEPCKETFSTESNYSIVADGTIHSVLMTLSEDATTPSKAHDTDAGWDIYLSEDVELRQGERKAVSTGLRLAIPEGYYAEIREKSGLALKSGIFIHGGIIDSDYRGEIKVIVENSRSFVDVDGVKVRGPLSFKAGEKIAQLIFKKQVDKDFVFTQVEKLDETARGEGGFGSTGK